MHPGRELTEDEQRVRRAGLRLLARMIAERMLAERAAAAGASQRPVSGPQPARGGDAEPPG